MAQKKEPVKKFRFGRIEVAIWENQTKQGEVWFNVEITRSYKADDKWQTSSKYGRDDLPLVRLGCEMAYAWIWEHQKDASEEQTEE